MLHLGPIWYHSEPSDVPYSKNLQRPISWFGLFLQQNDSSENIENLQVYEIEVPKYLILTYSFLSITKRQVHQNEVCTTRENA